MTKLINIEDFKFSVLMSVYYKENANFLKIAIDSIINQTVKPNEIVIVEDGKLTQELYTLISEYENQYENLFKIVPLEKNVGLGEALRIGVLNCSCDYIARMDSDDISSPERFEKQVKFMTEHPDIDIMGGWFSEFEFDPNEITGIRKLPLNHEDIYKYGQFRCPMDHVTVMFKKQSLIESGNYKPLGNIEDYYMWGRMLKQGYKFANIPECLVNVRAGQAMLKRRSGLNYFFKSELPLQTELLKIRYISLFQYFRNIFLKFLLRAVPFWAMTLIYQKFLRKETNNG